MKEIGITGKIFNIIKHMYSNTHFCVKKNNFVSQPILNDKGVKQGDSLSPTLFNIFLNDIGKCFNDQNLSKPLNLNGHNINHLLFADDLLIFSESKEGLQHCLNETGTYCNTWRLNINVKKTKVMLFSKGKRDYSKFSFFIQNSELEIVEKYKYLGIVFHFNGNLKHAAEDLYNKSLKAFFSLKSKFSNFDEVPIHISFKLFDSLIKPILTYGSEVWLTDYNINFVNADILPMEKLHHKMIKCVLGVKRQSSNMACRLECNRIPTLISSMTIMYNYYLRFLKMDQNRTLYKAFVTDQTLFQENSKSWYSTISSIFKLVKIDINDNIDSSTFTKKLVDFYYQHMTTQIERIKSGVTDSKLSLFSNIFIPDNKIPFYLSINQNKKIKSKITEMRISAHNLNIERGRYCKPKVPRSERFCKFCHDVETESHFLIACNKYNNIRTKLFQPYNMELCRSHENITARLLNPITANECITLYKFIRVATELRMMYNCDF